MSEMIEKVARAMCRADGMDPDEDWRDNGVTIAAVALPRGEEQRWRTYTRKALAALKALGEPTDDIAEVMGAHARNSMVDWRDLHEAFIDAALSPAPVVEENIPEGVGGMSDDPKELIKQMNMALDAFVQTFADEHFWHGSPVQHYAKQIKAMRENSQTEASSKPAQSD